MSGDWYVTWKGDAVVLTDDLRKLANRSGALGAISMQTFCRKFQAIAGPRSDSLFPLHQVATLSGTSIHVLRGWVRKGIVVPSKRGKQGQALESFFSYDQFLAVAVGVTMARHRASISAVRTAIRLILGALVEADIQKETTGAVVASHPVSVN